MTMINKTNHDGDNIIGAASNISYFETIEEFQAHFSKYGMSNEDIYLAWCAGKILTKDKEGLNE